MVSENLLITTGAKDKLPSEFNTFQSSAWNAISNAREALDDMYKTRPTIPDSAASAGVAVGNINYTPPSGKPAWNYTFSPPVWPNHSLILEAVKKGEVEPFTESAPAAVTPNIPTTPNPAMPETPGSAPVIANVVFPDAPLLKDVADPKEYALFLPTVPQINIPAFAGVKPSSAINKPSTNFTWSEEHYDSALLQQTMDQISVFMSGGVGIPEPVWEALWSRENDRENRAGIKQIAEINEEWSSRGFELPQGVQVEQIQEVRQSLQSSAASRARELAIQEANLEIENLRYAVQQGIALENIRGNWYQQVQGRLLEATRFSYQLQVEVFNSEVAFFNAQLQSYLAEAQVYKTEIDAEIVKLEAYKTELEGQRIIGELNQQEVDKYVALLQALNTTINLYNAELQGIKTQAEISSVQVDAYRSEIQAYGERIKAINLEYDGYKTAMEGAKIQSDIYDVNVKAFANKVQAYATQIDAESKNAQIDIEINKYKLEEYNTKIQAYVSELNAEVEKLKAHASEHDANTRAYVAAIENEKANVSAQTEKYKADIANANMTTQANISNADNNARNALTLAQLIQSGLEQIAKIEAAYAGSAFSAVNLSMNMSDSASNSSADV